MTQIDLSQFKKETVIGPYPKGVPANWIVFNAHRPLSGSIRPGTNEYALDLNEFSFQEIEEAYFANRVS